MYPSPHPLPPSLSPPECLKALGQMEGAVQSYLKVVEMAPQHLEARLCLSTLQQQLGRPLRALEALQPMYDPETLAQDAAAAQQVGGLGGAVCVCVCVCVFVCVSV